MSGLQLELPGPESGGGVPDGVTGATPRLTPRELKRAKKLAEKRKRSALASVPGNASKCTAAASASDSAAAADAAAASPRALTSAASAAAAAGLDEAAAQAVELPSDAAEPQDDSDERAKRPRQQESAELSQLFDEGLSQCAVECAKKSSASSPTEEEDAAFGHDDASSSRDGLGWQEMSAVPAYDASLKERCKVSSSQPFEWTVLSAAAEQAAVERFAQFGSRNAYGSPESDEERLDGTDFAEALMHWRFPESPLPPSLRKTFARNIAGGAAGRDRTRNDDKQYCLARLEEWGSSFRSLYSAFTNGGCSEVYIESKAFTIIFAKRTPGERFAGDDGYCAVLTRSTRGLRQRLEDEDVNYVLPREAAAGVADTESEASRDGVDEAEAAEIKRFVAQADADTIYKAQSKDVRDGTPSSLLVSTGGIEGVAGMYDFLLNYVKNGEGELEDVPTLFSTCPFYRASVGQARWEDLGATHSGSSRGARRGDGPCYTLDICGTLLPGNLAKLYAELDRRQPRGYQVRLKTTEKTRGVNVALGAPSGWSRPWMSDEDADGQQTASADSVPHVPPSHVISKVECRGGQFRVQTSSTGNA